MTYTLMQSRSQEACQTSPFHRYVLPSGAVWTEFHRRGSAYLLRFPGLADFEVSPDGTHVEGRPAPGTDPLSVEHLYLNQVLQLALSLRGHPVYHASAVAVPGGAVALLGRSGMGKSTLAAQFARAVAGFLTDDGLLLTPVPDGYLVQPHHPSIRLWRDSQEALIEGETAVAPPVGFTTKARFLAGDSLPYCGEPKRLLAAYLLDEPAREGIAIRRVSAPETVLAWITHSFLLDVEDPIMLSQHFHNATLVGGAIPTYLLCYPRRYECLGDVQEAILEHLSQPGVAG